MMALYVITGKVFDIAEDVTKLSQFRNEQESDGGNRLEKNIDY
jgi:hypothetical protein